MTEEISSTEENFTNSDTESQEDQVQNFLSNNYDYILDIYDELKEMFAMNPNFLNRLDSVAFCDYLIDIIFENNQTRVNVCNNFFTFIDVFYKEIIITHKYINKFLDKYKSNVTLEECEKFCFTYSELYNDYLM